MFTSIFCKMEEGMSLKLYVAELSFSLVRGCHMRASVPSIDPFRLAEIRSGTRFEKTLPSADGLKSPPP